MLSGGKQNLLVMHYLYGRAGLALFGGKLDLHYDALFIWREAGFTL